jgi:hypothetical protein
MGQTIGETALRLAKELKLNIRDVMKGLSMLKDEYESGTVEHELIFTIRGFFKRDWDGRSGVALGP